MTKFLLSILFIVTAYTVSAQTVKPTNKVIVDNTTHFVLSTSSDMMSVYQLDIKSLHFKSDEIASSFFGSISDNLLTYTFDKVSKTATLKLNQYPGSTITTVESWNKYIASNTGRYFKIYNEINK
jgi:hypothetical protein